MRRQDIELFNRLFAALEDDKVFLDAHLSLAKLSAIVGTNTTYLSYAINDYFGHNFRTVINTFRVGHAVNLLLGDGHPASFKETFHRCGFFSKSTFYAAFTKIMGVPPLQFIDEARRSGRPASSYNPTPSKQAILSSLSTALKAGGESFDRQIV